MASRMVSQIFFPGALATWKLYHGDIVGAMEGPAAGMHNARMLRRALPVVGFVVFVSAIAHSQAARSVQDGVFSDAQAARGQALYTAQCASCHGGKLEGAQGPPLVGAGFVANWQSQPLAELAGKI